MDRMNLTIDIQANEIGARRVNLRSSLLVANLITTIKDKFNLDGQFELRLENAAQPLSEEIALDQTGVDEGGKLICAPVLEASGTLDLIKRGSRSKLSPLYKRVYVQEERKLVEHDLAWQPAIIGRKDHDDPSKNKLLAVDLEGAEDHPTVSRHHACITEQNGAFFIESINPDNPTYLGNTRLKPNFKHPLAAGARLRVGRVILTFNIVS